MLSSSECVRRSDLLRMMSIGAWTLRCWSSVMETWNFCCMVVSGSLMSRMRSTRSATSISSRVEWKASMSQVGRLLMNPTVSVMRMGMVFFGGFLLIRRVVVESVEKSLPSTVTFSLVRRLRRLLFPALV